MSIHTSIAGGLVRVINFGSQKKYGEALTHFKKALKYNKDSSETLNWIKRTEKVIAGKEEWSSPLTGYNT